MELAQTFDPPSIYHFSLSLSLSLSLPTSAVFQVTKCGRILSENEEGSLVFVNDRKSVAWEIKYLFGESLFL